MFQTNKQIIYSVMVLTAIMFGIYSYFIIYHKMLFMDVEYAMWEYTKDKTQTSNEEHYNFLVLGDSRMKAAFIPEQFDDENLNSLNLSLGGSSAIEGYYTLRTYLKNNKKPDYLLVSYSPGMLTWHVWYWRRTVNFQYLNNDEFEEVYQISEEMDNHSTLGDYDYMDSQIYVGKYLTQLINGVMGYRWNDNKKMLEDLEKSKGHVFFGTGENANDLSYEATVDDFIPSKVLTRYVEKLLKLAQEEDIKVYWYTPPVNENSFANITDDYRSSYNAHMKTFERKYGMTVLKPIHEIKSVYFSDTYHVYKGAPVVTKSIKDNLIADLN
ncbi:MAG: hypothetical protein JKY84_06205 [Emcibacteraceae bacterium]|nr:hypothetical protein [Emcibacteraceae bacterium]